MTIDLINPSNKQKLHSVEGALADDAGNRFPVVRGVPRICDPSNYTENFGKQWNIFKTTQIDRPGEGYTPSETRFFDVTRWKPEELAGLHVLEVGSGAGRFSRVILASTQAHLWSVDYSSAVDANLQTNGAIAPERFHLFQASIYEMPFPDNSFDKVICLGVLQHTPDFEASVHALIGKAKRGGEIVVDFYPINGFWTKIHAKYLLRPITKRMPHDRLLKMIEGNADWMIGASRALRKVGLGALTRFLPVVDFSTLPRDMSAEDFREWVVLDTFDMFSPAYDNPQTVKNVAAMFARGGADVTFAGYVQAAGVRSATVRGLKR